MTSKSIDSLNHSDLTSLLKRRELSLWIGSSAESSDVSDLLGLPWVNIWNASAHIDPGSLLESAGQNRRVLSIQRPDQDHRSFRASEFIRVYDISLTSEATIRQKRFVDRLIDSVQGFSGVLCFIGDVDEYLADLQLVQELSPGLTIVVIDGDSSVLSDEVSDVLVWTKKAGEFSTAVLDLLHKTGDPGVADLKHAEGLSVDRKLLEDVSEYWTFLASPHVTPPRKIDQPTFDAFLNGDEVWEAYAEGIPCRRKNDCHSVRDNKQVDLVDEILEKAAQLELASEHPHEQLQQVLVFCETGSGSTTLLRQIAMELAKAGYPTMMSKPFARAFGGSSLERFVVDTQDRWLRKRKEGRERTGVIPFCLVVDADGEPAVRKQALPTLLQTIGRRVLLVRAFRRSADEIRELSGPVYTLNAEVTSEEIIRLGAHLREVADRHGLARMPSDEEWRAFHDGIADLSRRSPGSLDRERLDTPSLFLVGLYPFVKERVSDESSLEQYYYRKWTELDDENAKEAVRLLAAAGEHGLSVPFDSLSRNPGIDVLRLNALSKEKERVLDLFIRWAQPAHSPDTWYLYVRHSAIALLLCRAIEPSEGDLPFTALSPLLRNLSTNTDDVWFAGTLAFRLGQRFKGKSPRFSIETDTIVQRAARAVFSAIPDSVKSISRTIQHHEGRYHLHMLRTCIDALNDPKITVLPPEEVERIARREFDSATDFLEKAVDIQDEGETVSNVLNTLATAYFVVAEMLQGSLPEESERAFEDALDYGERSLKHDPANGIAILQYVQRIVSSVDISGDASRNVDMLSRAELRLAELIQLHEEKRWRNIEPVEAEKKLATLVQEYLKQIDKAAAPNARGIAFESKNPEASLFLKVRKLVGERSLEEAFRDNASVDELRVHRSELDELKGRTTRSDVYLYRLYLADPVGRLEFRKRLDLLQRLRRIDPEQFTPYRHDEATLHCQLDQLDIGARKLRELREFRRASQAQWFWLNERALLHAENGGKPRELILEVRDPVGGWAYLRDTDVRVKYQPYQFGEMSRNQAFRAYIRFTLNGLQAVTEKLIANDLAGMGL